MTNNFLYRCKRVNHVLNITSRERHRCFATNWFLIAIFTLSVTSLQMFGATLTVTNLADSGPGTLRNQITAAGSGDSIQFGLPGKVVLNSQLTISKNLNIYSYGNTLVRVSGNN